MKQFSQPGQFWSPSRVTTHDSPRKKLALFCSGNLAAETIALVYAELSTVPGCEVQILTDGKLYTHACRVAAPREVNPELPEAWLGEADLFITGIRSPGDVERRWIRAARRLGVPALVVLSDIGNGATKFKDPGGWALPDVLAVPDQITWGNLKTAGIPEAILFPLGSPYLDEICERPLPCQPNSNRITLFDLPNADDFSNMGISAPYTELQVVGGFTESVAKLRDVRPVVRPHPKQRADPAYRASPFSERAGTPLHLLESLEECIGASKIVVSTYSTCLLLAHRLGRHAVSYQPNTGHNAVRRDLYFATGIPIATSACELMGIIERMLTEPDPPPSTPSFLFNPGSSLNALSALVERLLLADTERRSCVG